MSGTKAGALKTKHTNLEKYGMDYYANIGSKGGKAGTKENGSVKGFAANIERAKAAGKKGGLISRRGKKKAVVTV
jgi:general stress protein YciG